MKVYVIKLHLVGAVMLGISPKQKNHYKNIAIKIYIMFEYSSYQSSILLQGFNKVKVWPFSTREFQKVILK